MANEPMAAPRARLISPKIPHGKWQFFVVAASTPATSFFTSPKNVSPQDHVFPTNVRGKNLQ